MKNVWLNRLTKYIAILGKQTELFMPAVIVLVVAMLIIPIPPFFINFFVAISITFSLLAILLTMFVNEPLEFAAFPSVILMTTVYRLALGITTTRAILAWHDAGAIIHTFGTFVIGGSYVIGAVIFAIIMVVNYTVITHGAQRIGEVAARFTLDAMPGKQMSIDADLNNGLITDDEARARRRKIEQEADYFGAMDGAARFVQRDAMAGIIITFINLIAGFVMGMVIHGMTAMESIQTYTILTIGDGLVMAIPSLLMSTATGVMVTNAASEVNLSADIVRQMFAQTRPMGIGAGIMGVAAFGSLFLGNFQLTATVGFIALVLGALSFALGRPEVQEAIKSASTVKGKPGAPRKPGAPGATPAAGEAPVVPPTHTPEAVTSMLHVDVMELEIGYGLIPLVDPEQKGDLLDRVTMIRRQTALEMGIVVPPIRIRDNIQLKPNEYSIKIRGTEVADGTLLVDHYLAMNPGNVSQEIEGIDTVEPAFGLPAKWIREGRKDQAEMLGYTVVDPASVIATHLTEVIKNHAYELLGRQELQQLIDIVKERNSVVIEELIPTKLTLGEVQKVLQNLLRERVSIRNMVSILETLADYAPLTKDVHVLTEYVRASIGRQICRQHQMPDGTLPVITLDPRFEEVVHESVQQTGTASYPVLPPDIIQQFSARLTEAIEKAVSLNYQPIVLCSPRVRMYMRRLVERLFPQLVVLSHSEITPEAKVRSVASVTA